MPTPVEIVIRAVDRFSPAFAGLDTALRRSGESGRAAADALGGVGAAFTRLGEAGAAAELALTEFAVGAGQRLSERLLAQDEATAARRSALRDARFAQERQAVDGHHKSLQAAEAAHRQQLLAMDQAFAASRLKTMAGLADAVQALAQSHGGALARGAKALAVAEALISAYLAGNKALASVPFPFNLAAAAAVTAQGLATVERIRQTHVAHGGLERVPEESTYLLQRGERVLAAGQNRRLTRFLDEAEGGRAAGIPGGSAGGSAGGGAGGSAGSVVIENLTIHVLENATSAEALLSMERAALRQVVSERLIPAMDELARLGIRPHFVRENT